MKTLKLLSGMAVMAIILNGCTKDGATGATGPAGTNGVANISSNIYSVTPGSWSNPSTGEYLVKISDASITDADQDGIEVFISTSTGLYLGLPSTNLLVSGDQMEFAYETGDISLIYLNSSAPSSTIDLKVVVIPPAMMKQHPGTNWKDANSALQVPEVQAAVYSK